MLTTFPVARPSALRCGADDRQTLEQLCRCMTRLVRRDHALGNVTAGVHAEADGAGTATAVAPALALRSVRGELAVASQRNSGATVSCRRRASRKRALVGDSLRFSADARAFAAKSGRGPLAVDRSKAKQTL